MINILTQSLKIDLTYSINSFIYILKKSPIFKDLIVGNDIYKNKILKFFIRIILIILALLKLIVIKSIYFSIIYLIVEKLNKSNLSSSFITAYIIFTIIGMIINNNLLSTSTKKYFSIILFNMNANKYLKADLISSLFINFILNTIFLLMIITSPIAIILSLFTLLLRIIGESLNIMYYRKYNDLIINNYKIYWTVVITGLLLILLLLKNNILTNNNLAILITLISIPISIMFLIYLISIKNYKAIYKKLNPINKVMNQELEKEYTRQKMVEVKNKDKYINSKKLKGKHGYDLFNTIFFERHKEILLRSAKKYSAIIFISLITIIILTIYNKSFAFEINKILLTKFSWLVLFMYFINRGAIVTQAMFYNCDHAMLTFNFYRNKDVILNIFKQRLITLIKINLLPAIILAIFLPIIIYITGSTTNIIDYISIPLFIIVLSIFFSTHYLIIYYLLQPYNKKMQLKSISYMIVSFFTYFISYQLTKITLSPTIFSLLGIIITIIYIILGISLVYKYAPRTFKIKK